MPPAELATSKRRLKISAMVLLGLLVIGATGFYIIGVASGKDRGVFDSIYLTAVVLSTVGAWHKSGMNLNVYEEIWIVLLIVFGIGTATFAISNVMALAFGGEFQRIMGRRQLTGKINQLLDHYIVCGFGRMGRSICQTLARDGVNFITIDKSTDKTAQADELGYLYVLGDAADEDILQMAGIDRARGLVACLPHDADNVFVTLTARELNAKLMIIARAEQVASEPRLGRAGADRVVCPPTIGALKVTRMLLHPAVEDLLDATVSEDMAIDKVSVSNLEGFVGQSLRELALPNQYGLMVLSVVGVDGRRLFSPPADHVLADGEQLIVIGTGDSVQRLAADHGG